jgi:hypothetical protein
VFVTSRACRFPQRAGGRFRVALIGQQRPAYEVHVGISLGVDVGLLEERESLRWALCLAERKGPVDSNRGSWAKAFEQRVERSYFVPLRDLPRSCSAVNGRDGGLGLKGSRCAHRQRAIEQRRGVSDRALVPARSVLIR